MFAHNKKIQEATLAQQNVQLYPTKPSIPSHLLPTRHPQGLSELFTKPQVQANALKKVLPSVLVLPSIPFSILLQALHLSHRFDRTPALRLTGPRFDRIYQ